MEDLIHVYPDRVALCITDHCPSYCRHCFRKRRTGEQPPADAFERALTYLESHREIRDVLVTGGDPLTFPDEKLIRRLSRIRAIGHVEILRVGTRIPAFLPM
ncbi:MAG: radical SAM protein, partial [Spirochaetota bacterium]